MRELPPCRWRGEEGPGESYPCSSPLVAGIRVSWRVCCGDPAFGVERCRVIDHEPVEGATKEQARRTEPATVEPCTYRGLQIREQLCEPCKSRTGKRVLVPVFACKLHGECVHEAIGYRIKACNLCEDRLTE